jgi:hypothetical protein
MSQEQNTPTRIHVEALKKETSFKDLEKELREGFRHTLDPKLQLPHAYLQRLSHTLDQCIDALEEMMSESPIEKPK